MSFVLHGDVDPVAVPDELQGGQRRVDVNFAADDVDGRLAQSAAAREGQRPPARVCGPKTPGGAAQSLFVGAGTLDWVRPHIASVVVAEKWLRIEKRSAFGFRLRRVG